MKELMSGKVCKNHLCIVQFPHPGPEYRVDCENSLFCDEGYKVEWRAEGTHCRRLIRHKGQYVDAEWTLHDNADLQFWNEWEGPTFAQKLPARTSATAASFVHTVVYPEVASLSALSGGCV